MEEKNNDAKPEELTSTESSTEQKEQTPTVSEDAKTQEPGKSYQTKYEEAREAMKQERESKRAEKQRADDLEVKIADMAKGGEKVDPKEIKDNTISLIKSDPFALENIDLIEAKVEEGLSTKDAIAQVKADFFDRMRDEGKPAESNIPKQQKPTAAAEPTPSPTNVKLEDVLSGKVEVDPAQLAAIKRVLPNRR